LSLLSCVTFDISVKLVVIVQILQTHEQFADDDNDVVLGDATRPHEITTATTRAVFHDDPQIRALQVGAIVFCRVGRVEAREDGDFLDDVVYFVFCVLDIDDLDGDGLAGAFLDTSESRRSVVWTYNVSTSMRLTPCRPFRSCHHLLHCISVRSYKLGQYSLLTNAGLLGVECLGIYCPSSKYRRHVEGVVLVAMAV
jgi:hypothetical protein